MSKQNSTERWQIVAAAGSVEAEGESPKSQGKSEALERLASWHMGDTERYSIVVDGITEATMTAMEAKATCYDFLTGG